MLCLITFFTLFSARCLLVWKEKAVLNHNVSVTTNILNAIITRFDCMITRFDIAVQTTMLLKFRNDPNWVELRTWKISDLYDWLAYIHQDFLNLQNRILSVCQDSYLIALSINELTCSNTWDTEQGKFYEKV